MAQGCGWRQPEVSRPGRAHSLRGQPRQRVGTTLEARRTEGQWSSDNAPAEAEFELGRAGAWPQLKEQGKCLPRAGEELAGNVPNLEDAVRGAPACNAQRGVAGTADQLLAARSRIDEQSRQFKPARRALESKAWPRRMSGRLADAKTTAQFRKKSPGHGRRGWAS